MYIIVNAITNTSLCQSSKKIARTSYVRNTLWTKKTHKKTASYKPHTHKKNQKLKDIRQKEKIAARGFGGNK